MSEFLKCCWLSISICLFIIGMINLIGVLLYSDILVTPLPAFIMYLFTVGFIRLIRYEKNKELHEKYYFVKKKGVLK